MEKKKKLTGEITEKKTRNKRTYKHYTNAWTAYMVPITRGEERGVRKEGGGDGVQKGRVLFVGWLVA